VSLDLRTASSYAQLVGVPAEARKGALRVKPRDPAFFGVGAAAAWTGRPRTIPTMNSERAAAWNTALSTLLVKEPSIRNAQEARGEEFAT
jgi:hypothetical protein